MPDPKPTLGVDELIWADPERMGGVPCFRGTRLPVSMLVAHLAGGGTVPDFIDDYPPVTREQVLGVLEIGLDAVLERAGAA